MIAQNSKYKQTSVLYAWIVRNKLSITKFCVNTKISRTSLYSIFNGNHSPDIMTITRIVIATKGEVLMSDLVSGKVKENMRDLMMDTGFHLLDQDTKTKISRGMLK